MSLDVVVIIVNWNTRDELRACLQSLFAEPRPAVRCEVWVADNASTDDSVRMAAREFSEARLERMAQNIGFVRANNRVIEKTESRFVFLLNSDAFIHPGALDTLVAWADAHPEAGIVGPKVLNLDGTLQMSCRRFPSLGAGFFRNTLLGRFFPTNKYAADYLMSEFDHRTARAVDWVSGCAMLIRRTLIDEIGAFDERFVAYCEDVDLCRRAAGTGRKVVYLPDAVVTHAIGRSSDKNAEAMIIEFHRSWYKFDKKRHPDASALRRVAVLTGLGLRAGVRIARRRWAERQRRERG